MNVTNAPRTDAGGLSISIVVYRPDAQLLERTLASLAVACEMLHRRDPCLPLAVYIIDNGGFAEVPAKLGLLTRRGIDCRVVSGHGNVGFGCGHNLAIECTLSCYHLILNPDIDLDPAALSEALDFFAVHPEAGLLTPRIGDADGHLQFLCRRFPTVLDLFVRGFLPVRMWARFGHRLARYQMCDVINERDVVWDPPIVSGCFMLFRTVLLKQLGGFDPRYFLYFEDYDLSLRTHELARVAVQVLQPFRLEMAVTRILVTGANGFVGQVLCHELLGRGHQVTGLVRSAGGHAPGVREWVLGDGHPGTGAATATPPFASMEDAWPRDLAVDAVVHLAARVHVMRDDAADPLARFRATNVDGTLRVARAARRHGARCFVYVSSIKAIAETDAGRPLSERDPAQPEDAYGRSKLEAEQALADLGVQTGLEIVIVRPPLVYGPRVRANFLSLMTAIARGVPLPLGAIDARRSVVYVGNLAHALALCATESGAAGGCFHVADDDDPSVAGLARAIGRHLRRPARLLPVPVGWLRAAGRLTGHMPQVERLVTDLRVDTSRLRTVLGWRPPYSLDDGLAATAAWYRSTH
ncbi:hypothetical protein DFQ28_005850 [Apophysomyces sp. BC1034]|nr:hypothetical protein DFQ28_005850 [Apophysomyces sp. BC1034]